MPAVGTHVDGITAGSDLVFVAGKYFGRIDKDIDHFVKEIGKFYQVNDSLPKHYREALTLYTHSRSNPLFVYRSAVTEEDYKNFREMENEYPMLSERKGKLGENFRGTYWYYYKYE